MDGDVSCGEVEPPDLMKKGLRLQAAYAAAWISVEPPDLMKKGLRPMISIKNSAVDMLNHQT